MRTVFVREDAAFEFARFDGCGDGVVMDGPEEEDIVVGAAEQVEGAVFRLRGVFEDGEEELGLGFDARGTQGEGEDLGLLGFVLRRGFHEFEQTLRGIADMEGEDFIRIIRRMPGAFPVGSLDLPGRRTKIVCHMGFRAGSEQERESQASSEAEEVGLHAERIGG